MVDDLLISLILAPLLIPQILYTKKTTIKLKEPVGERCGLSGNGPSIKLLILGDSAAAGVGVTHQDNALTGQLLKNLSPKYSINWRLQAKTGVNTSTVIRHLDNLDSFEVDVVLLSLGVNDVTSLTKQSEWLRLLDKLRFLLVSKFKAKHILLTSLPPMHVFPSLPQPLRWFLGRRAKAFNRGLSDYSELHEPLNLITLDFPISSEFIAEDGFHPSGKAYQLWSEMAAKQIEIIYAS